MDQLTPAKRSVSIAARLPFYYGWVHVVLAAVAMTATLPGRTHGLGLITEPLVADLGITRTAFAQMNLVGALLGALFCVPIGWAIDRWGVRLVATGVVAALAAAVVGMTNAAGPASLLASLVAVRGLGQSALSVASIAIVSKWFDRRLGLAMGPFSVLLTFGFIAAILTVGADVQTSGWRGAWRSVAVGIACVAPLLWLLLRDTPEACGVSGDAPKEPLPDEPAGQPASASLLAALRNPAFWAFALGAAAFNLAWAGLTLFNESILAERGFEQQAAVTVMAILTGCGLVANLVCGALAKRRRLNWLLAGALVMLAIAMGSLPLATQPWQLYAYATALGLSGGAMTVLFFAAWGSLFGRESVGRIQGAAQAMTVTASACGPLLMATCKDSLGAYSPMLYTLAGVAAGLAVFACFVRPPALATQ